MWTCEERYFYNCDYSLQYILRSVRMTEGYTAFWLLLLWLLLIIKIHSKCNFLRFSFLASLCCIVCQSVGLYSSPCGDIHLLTFVPCWAHRGGESCTLSLSGLSYSVNHCLDCPRRCSLWGLRWNIVRTLLVHDHCKDSIDDPYEDLSCKLSLWGLSS